MNAAQDACLVTPAWKYDLRRFHLNGTAQNEKHSDPSTEGMRYLRSTMTGKRLSSLAVLGIESKRTKALDLTNFVRRFAEQDGNRRIQL